MAVLTDKQFNRFSEALGHLYDGHSPDTAVERMIRATSILFPGRLVAFNAFDHASKAYWPVTNRPVPEERKYLPRLQELTLLEHPFIHAWQRGHRFQVAATNHILPAAKWERTAIVHEIFSPLGVGIHQGMLVVQGNGMPEGMIINQERPFSEDEAFLQKSLQRHISSTWVRSQLLRCNAATRQRIDATDFHPLLKKGITRRECDVLCWLCEGKTDPEIAIILNISVKTVNNHVASILRKLDCENRTMAAHIAGDLLSGG